MLQQDGGRSNTTGKANFQNSNMALDFQIMTLEEQVIEIARSMESFARSLGCDDDEFSPKDAGRFAFQLAFSVF